MNQNRNQQLQAQQYNPRSFNLPVDQNIDYIYTNWEHYNEYFIKTFRSLAALQQCQEVLVIGLQLLAVSPSAYKCTHNDRCGAMLITNYIDLKILITSNHYGHQCVLNENFQQHFLAFQQGFLTNKNYLNQLIINKQTNLLPESTENLIEFLRQQLQLSYLNYNNVTRQNYFIFYSKDLLGSTMKQDYAISFMFLEDFSRCYIIYNENHLVIVVINGDNHNLRDIIQHHIGYKFYRILLAEPDLQILEFDHNLSNVHVNKASLYQYFQLPGTAIDELNRMMTLKQFKSCLERNVGRNSIVRRFYGFFELNNEAGVGDQREVKFLPFYNLSLVNCKKSFQIFYIIKSFTYYKNHYEDIPTIRENIMLHSHNSDISNYSRVQQICGRLENEDHLIIDILPDEVINQEMPDNNMEIEEEDNNDIMIDILSDEEHTNEIGNVPDAESTNEMDNVPDAEPTNEIITVPDEESTNEIITVPDEESTNEIITVPDDESNNNDINYDGRNDVIIDNGRNDVIIDDGRNDDIAEANTQRIFFNPFKAAK
ncbi:uncharacterized protein KGF55_001204 [Candida pseudojiufengensis]|uniref:uncharacterized protein n=1 Tax=Candida pseudojiufengensis TaxID=497109 RepID=UPI002224532A|nr:uncharacterized protein KGF55_001204 [Candida pseudojiufengensis]KAI5965841.1 hypothetical protein KGF55_001204 [Candida pseudojiufengensis]